MYLLEKLYQMFQFLKKILRGGIAFRFQVLRIMPPESLCWASLSTYANQGLVEESLFSCRREAQGWLARSVGAGG